MLVDKLRPLTLVLALASLFKSLIVKVSVEKVFLASFALLTIAPPLRSVLPATETL